MPGKRRISGRAIVFRAVFVFLMVALLIGVPTALFHPDSPLPDESNPLTPLDVAAPVSPMTEWKLRVALSSPQACLAALKTAAEFRDIGEVAHENPNCGIEHAVDVRSVGDARADTLTDCQTALRLAMWERHSVQPAAREILGQSVRRINTFGSYNCRKIRSTRQTDRYSKHATAMALDVSGFELANGQSLRLIRDWDGDDTEAQFLRETRNGACKWFVTTLSPEYNSLHADHFHMQASGWGTCR